MNIKQLRLFLVILFTNIYFILMGQTNYIRNYSFEDANFTPGCQYAVGTDKANDFDEDMVYWAVARSPGLGVPDWIDITTGCMSGFFFYLCNPPPPFSSNRFIYLQTQWHINNLNDIVIDNHDGIRIGLQPQPLVPGEEYIIIMKVLPSSVGTYPFSTFSKLRVFLTTYGWNWNSTNSDNQIYEAVDANVEMAIHPGCNWQRIERTIVIPNNYDDLKNLVLYSEENGYCIDDVELYKKSDYYCTPVVYVQNKTYDYYFYNSNIQNIPFVVSANNQIYAGNNVTSGIPNGNVLIQDGATITYKAGAEIFLEDGFIVEEGAFFDAYIDPCTNNKSPVIPDGGNLQTVENGNSIPVGNEIKNGICRQEENLTITPNPSQGIFTIQFANGVLENGGLQLINMLGNVVYEEMLKNQPSQQIDLRGFAEGMYYLHVFNKEQSFSEKIVIAR